MNYFGSTIQRLILAVGVLLCSTTCLPKLFATLAVAQIPINIGQESVKLRGGDVIALHVFDDPDLNQNNVRLTDSGDVPLLLVGPVHIAGMTPGEASKMIADVYMARNILVNAHVQITLESASSTDVTVIGYVNGLAGQTTGVAFPLNSPKPLLKILALAGGLSDRASRNVTIQRGGNLSDRVTVHLPTDANADLDNDPLVYPGDLVVVPRAGIVYVLGTVGSPKAVVMNEDGSLTLLQAMSQAGGPLPTSGLKKVMVFRKLDGQYSPLQINVGAILKGRAPDIALMPEDAVYVPFSYGKNILVNSASITAALAGSTATGLVYAH